MLSRDHHRHQLDLAALVAVDATDGDEAAEHEAHRDRCAVCSEQATALAEVAALLSTGCAHRPPPGLRARVLAAIADAEQLPAQPIDLAARRLAPRPRHLLPVAAAAAVVALVFGIGIGSGPVEPSVDDVVGAADAVVTELEGGDATVRVAWSPGKDRVAVLADGLEDPGAGRAYALWLLGGNEPVAAGLFTPDGGKVSTVLAVADLRAQGWGITIEPAAGSDQPTGEILFSGEV